jgi:bifunctional oligoribonuclease and PAP phosphatase NrnA
MDLIETFSPFLSKFKTAAETSQSILLSAHMNPDDDAVGSLMGLYLYLTKEYPGKTITMAISSKQVDRWEYFSPYKKIQYGTDVGDMIADYEMFVALDTSEYSRLSLKPELIESYSGKTFCIDHHTNEPKPFGATAISTQPSSTAQIVYMLFYSEFEQIDVAAAEVLLLGILGDTAWFNVNMKLTNLEMFDIVKKLVGDGQIDLETFGSKYKAYPSRTFEVIQECVKNAKFYEFTGWPKLISTFITREFVRAGNFTELELREGSHIYTASYNKSLKDVPWGATFYPSLSGEVNCSLRSRPGGVDVSAIGKTMGLGGGHKGASGMTFKNDGELVDPQKAMNEFFEWLKVNKPVEYSH